MVKVPSCEELKKRTMDAVIPDDPRANLDEFQMAKLLGVSVFKLRRDRWAGGGVPYLKIGGLCRYRREDADAFMVSKIRISTSDTGEKQRLLGKNFRRVNSCFTCSRKLKSRGSYYCSLDGVQIRDNAKGRTNKPVEFVCDDFK